MSDPRSTEPGTPQRTILVLGGGFAGLHGVLRLQRRLRRRDRARIVLVSRENFFSFTPMLHEVASSELDLGHIVSPLRKLLRDVDFVLGEVAEIDLARRIVRIAHGSDGHPHEIAFDHLVLALGSTTNFFGIPGLADSALCMKSLGDAIELRNRVIRSLEEADTDCAAALRQRLGTVIVAGGGFAGVETLAAVNDFARESLRFYPNLEASDLRMVLVHPGETILPELDPRLGRYAQRKLAERGVELRLGARVAGVGDDGVRLSDGSTIDAGTLVWTAGTAAPPLLAALPLKREGGRIVVEPTLQVPGHPGLWAVGDCACVPDESGRPHPPTAQHAIRAARVLADNLIASLRGRPLRAFRFRTLGQLATIGRRAGVAQIFGLRFSGFVAWWLWRSIYLAKLPRLEKKLRVMLDWTLDLVFSRDLVQFTTSRSSASVRNGAAAPK